MNKFFVCSGEESREESQQDGIQGRESPTGEANVEPEDKCSRPEALEADRRLGLFTFNDGRGCSSLQWSWTGDKRT